MAGNQDQLEISIVLDDGSIQKGFINLQKRSDETAKKIENNFDKATGALKDGLEESLPSIANIGRKIASVVTNPFVLITSGIVGIGLALEKAFDLTIAGEKLNKIDKQFQALTESFGIAGEQLKSKFVGSLGGLVDDSDAVQSLNKALVLLGDKAQQLPQIMELARKATNLFGGEVTDNFEAINQAIASGATRQLRGLGIIVNADEAYLKYAKTLGISKDALSEAGKQQAILNEVLEKGEKRFRNIDSSSETATNTVQRFKVATNNSFEEIEKSFGSTLGPIFERIINQATDLVNKGDSLSSLAVALADPVGSAARLGSAFVQAATGADVFSLSTKDLKKRISEAQDQIGQLDKTIGSLNALKEGSTDQGLISKTNSDLEKLQKRSIAAQENLKTLFSALSTKISPDTDTSLFGPKAAKSTASSDIDFKKATDERKSRELDLSNFLLEQETARVAARVAAADKSASFFEQEDQTRLVQEEQLSLLAQQQASKRLEIEKKFSSDKRFSVEQREQAIQALEKNFQDQNASLLEQNRAKISAIEDRQNADRIERAKQYAQVINQALTSIVSGGLQRLGQALVNGTASFDDFGKAVLDIIADAAIHIGELILAMGIATTALAQSLASFNGGAAIAAGAALIVLGAALKAASTHGPGSSSSNTGGGIATGPSTTTELAGNTSFQNPTANTQVQVVVNGSIYDSDDTGSRIVDLINSAFDKKGVVIQQGAVA